MRLSERQRRPSSEQHGQPADHQEVKGEDGSGRPAAHFAVFSGEQDKHFKKMIESVNNSHLAEEFKTTTCLR